VSFVWQADERMTSKEDAVRTIHAVALRRGLDDLATVMCIMCVLVESDFWCPYNDADPCSEQWPHDSQSDDGLSVGYYQQQCSAPGVSPPWGWGGLYGDPEGSRKRMSLEESTDLFLNALCDDYEDARDNPQKAGAYVQQVQGSAFPDRYAQKWDEAWDLYNRAIVEHPVPLPTPTPVAVTGPSFNEVNFVGQRKISGQCQNRQGTTIDLCLGHTTEGAGGLELIDFMENMGDRSYHYVIDNDPDGNTVYDLVDTDAAAWACLDANNRSINYVIGRSTVNWSRDDWIGHARNAIRIMAWLMVADCKKYGIQPRVISPPYEDDPPGIADHAYVTEHLGVGDHTDMGPNFPWDVLAHDVEAFMSGQPEEPMPSKEASRSIYRDNDDSIGGIDEVLRQTNGMLHEARVEILALLGEPASLAKVQRVADGKAPVKLPDWAADRAKTILAAADKK
jgi:N-acetyl-anhydromuramyl-L-alanine amidase AmpD